MPFDSLGFTTFQPETKPVEAPDLGTPQELWRTVLLDAADYIEAHGWWTANPSPWQSLVYLAVPRARNCALTSIIRVGLSGPATMEARVHFMRHIGGGPIHFWNDTPGRTAAEVCAALRACAVQP